MSVQVDSRVGLFPAPTVNSVQGIFFEQTIDYSQVFDGLLSRFYSTTCAGCSFQYTEIYPWKRWCPNCSYNFFIGEARRVHGDRYDYSSVDFYSIRSLDSYVPIRCRSCNSCWEQSVTSHLNLQQDCLNCAQLKCQICSYNPANASVKSLFYLLQGGEFINQRRSSLCSSIKIFRY